MTLFAGACDIVMPIRVMALFGAACRDVMADLSYGTLCSYPLIQLWPIIVMVCFATACHTIMALYAIQLGHYSYGPL